MYRTYESMIIALPGLGVFRILSRTPVSLAKDPWATSICIYNHYGKRLATPWSDLAARCLLGQIRLRLQSIIEVRRRRSRASRNTSFCLCLCLCLCVLRQPLQQFALLCSRSVGLRVYIPHWDTSNGGGTKDETAPMPLRRASV